MAKVILTQILKRSYRKIITQSVSTLCFTLSLFLSILLWRSLASDSLHLLIFTGFAFLFEIGKMWSTLSLKDKRYLNLLVFVLLTIVSVAGSVGGMQSSFGQNRDMLHQKSQRYQNLQKEVQAQADLLVLDEAIAKKDMDANFKTKANAMLQYTIPEVSKKITLLKNEMKHAPIEGQNSAIALISNIAILFHLKDSQVSQGLFLLIALLIELLSVFFVFEDKKTKPIKIKTKEKNKLKKRQSKEKKEKNQIKEKKAANNVFDILSLQNIEKNIEQGKFPCSVTKLMKKANIGFIQAAAILEGLEEKGVVKRLKNKRFVRA